MADESRERRARSFGVVAETYARFRPGYPKEAIRWLLPPAARRVLDVGAGTGALSALLVETGLEVVAVEPDPDMRRVLTERVPRADVRAGQAEELPLEAGEVDAVLGAQMWHWVDPVKGATEVARVLRPGGTLGLLWNLRDERVPWMAALGEIIRGEDVLGAEHEGVRLPADAPFGPSETRQFPWSQQLTPEGVVELMRTRSQVQVLDDAAQREILGRVADLVRTHPGVAGQDQIAVPYVTVCFRAVRQDSATVTAR